MHSPQIVVELREAPPEDGWACYEATSRACFVCTCGTTTGFVDRAEAIQTATEHPGRGQSPWIDGPREPLKVDVRLVGIGTDIKDFVRRMIRKS
ncbi:hypothetical protein [Streptomyces sp. NPDC050164]|uniref:hypothetical protein n=1 Tax=Streptomyces sp. NPDC050164 TaxID=3365605 RepID=UPI0037A51484